MPGSEKAIEGHYGSTDICARIVDSLIRAGRDPDKLERRDLTPFDEFHGGGIASTRDLARFADLREGMRVLDIGSGIGGPARTLAAEFGCRVSGLDLTQEFVSAATMLTGKLDMSATCDFRQGSATDLPFDDAEFDVVWSQNMLMNIADKAQLAAEVARVLRPSGMFAFETVLEGNGEPIHLPTFWASDASMNFLLQREALHTILADAGLACVRAEDTTAAVIEQGQKRQRAVTDPSGAALSIAVIVPDEVTTKMTNALRNNVDGRTTTLKAVYRKTG